ncbi:MAG: hypothetical protein KAV87_15675 [Desulfobacteraceae bacterium]|nr:hypothetical protein [Desulfobacteraceae bacterium]
MKDEIEITESPLYLGLYNLALEITSKLDAERRPWEPRNHMAHNWASEYHHPCKKYLVHCRLDWKQRHGIDLDGRWRVEEGIDKEWMVKKWLGDVGFEITQSQAYWNTDDPALKQFKALKISGKIDGMVATNGKLPDAFQNVREVPVEGKSTSPHFWDSTKTIEDIKRHSKFWISKIPSQLNTYLVFTHSPGGLLIICTFGKKPRIIPMLFDQELWDADCTFVKSVNYYVHLKKYPEPMPFDPTVCGMCDFDHICTPLRTTGLIEIDAVDEMELELYLELKDQKKQFEDIHARLIGKKDKPGKYHGSEAMAGNIEIKTIRYPKKTFAIPDEVKQKYRGKDDEVVKTTIERITK